MQTYSKYIARQVTHSTALTALSLTSIIWLTQALRLMDYIVNQGIGIDMFLMLTVMLIPSLLIMILPVALFVAVIFVYQKLRGESELVVLESAGVSRFGLVKPALKVACGVAVLGYFVAFLIMPVAYAKFRETQLYLRNNYASVLLQEGVFSTPIDGLTVYVRERSGTGDFKGIMVHDNRQPGLAITMMAETGRLVSTNGSQRFHLTNGNRQEMRSGKLSLLNFDSYALDMSMYAKEGGARIIDTREMMLPELVASEGLTPDEITERRGELHHRLLWPAYAFAMTLAGLAILLSGEFSRRSNGWRAIGAAVVVVMISTVAVFMRNLVALSPVYLVVAYANLIIPVAAALYALREKQDRK